jgi:spore maturation protein SpmB
MVTKQTVFRGTNKAVRLILNLLKYIIPSIFIMKILEHSGWLLKISDFFAPYMAYIGLPGEGALVLMFGQVTIFSGVAAMTILNLTAKQLTIMCTVMSISHVLVLETAIITKSGANGLLNAASRIAASAVTGFVLNLIIPGV